MGRTGENEQALESSIHILENKICAIIGRLHSISGQMRGMIKVLKRRKWHRQKLMTKIFVLGLEQQQSLFQLCDP